MFEQRESVLLLETPVLTCIHMVSKPSVCVCVGHEEGAKLKCLELHRFIDICSIGTVPELIMVGWHGLFGMPRSWRSR